MAGPFGFGKVLFGWILFIVLAAMLFMALSKSQAGFDEIPLSDFKRLLQDDHVGWVEINKDRLLGEFRREETFGDKHITRFRVELPEGTTSNWEFNDWLLSHAGDTPVHADNAESQLKGALMSAIPWVVGFGFIWFFVFRQIRKQRALAPQEKPPLKVFVVNQPDDPSSKSE